LRHKSKISPERDFRLGNTAAGTVLISGIGIAGPTLADWLARYGFKPTLVEHSPTLRTSGYIIDFWGLGYDIAEWMGLFPSLRAAGYDVPKTRLGLFFRNHVTHAFTIPGIAKLAMGRSLLDRLELPDYSEPHGD
jgi:flavin-dependent dehydrogenase